MLIPGSFPQEEENQKFNYALMSTYCGDREDPGQPWTQGESPDGKGKFSFTDQPGGGTADLEEVIEEMHNKPEGNES